VAYLVNYARTSQFIDVAATDGSGKLERLAASDFLIPNDWSADGRFLVYQNVQNGGPELDFLDLRKHSQIACGPGAEAQFSPDGKWIAFIGPGSIRCLRCMWRLFPAQACESKYPTMPAHNRAGVGMEKNVPPDYFRFGDYAAMCIRAVRVCF
jgi:hypothetical protein